MTQQLRPVAEKGAELMSRRADVLRRAGEPVPEHVIPFELVPLQADSAAEGSLPSLDNGQSPLSASQLTIARGSHDVQAGTSPTRFAGFNSKLAGKLVVTPEMPAAVAEQYRKLAATLHVSPVERDLRLIMITSALPGEGKTLTAVNLALTLSESYRRQVLLIDADLRRPALYDFFQLPNVAGLSDWLKAPSERKLTAIQVSERLAFLPAGRPDPDPTSGLTSDRMRRLLKHAGAIYDWVIIDTPPVGLLTDANLLVNTVDGVLLVVRAGGTPYELIERAVQALGRDRLLGVVMNCTNEGLTGNRYGYYGYYRHGQS